MKSKAQIIINTIVIALAVGAFFFSYNRNNKIAYVESSRLLSGYQGMIDASQAYQQKAMIWKANIDTLSKEFQIAATKYEQEKNTLSKKERELTEEILSNKQRQLIDYQRSIEEKAREEDQKMTQDVLTQVNGFMKQYAKEHGYDIVMGATESGNIVYTKDTYNITDEVLEGLNKAYSE